MRPDDVLFTGTELAITWEDGHQSFYSLEQLRRSCPCARCQGESVLFKQAPAQPGEYRSASFEADDWTPVGNYAMQIIWGDGHQTGIYRWDRLRASCSCSECASSSDE